MNTAYIMCGVPGSGKTTTAKKLEKKLQLERFSFDDMNCFRLQEYMKQGIQSLRNGKNVIFDTTNLRVNVRKKIIQVLENIPCRKVVVFMDTSFEECLYRNANREARLQDFVVESSYRALQCPTLAEGWDEIIYVKEDDDIEVNFKSD